MDMIFTGTGSGKVSLEREFSSILLSSDNYNLLVDAGDGISKALLKQNIPYNNIDGILLTHFHPDHFTGLPTLLVQMKMNKRIKPLDIFIDEQLVKNLKTFLDISYVFVERMDFDFNIKPLKNNTEVAINDNLSFIPRQNSHMDKYDYLTSFKHLPVSSIGVLFLYGNKKVFYTGDCSNESDLYLFSDYLLNVLIAEASHLPSASISAFAENNHLSAVYLTHVNETGNSPFPSGKYTICTDGLKISV